MPLPIVQRRQKRANRRRRLLEQELHTALLALRANDAQFQLAADPCYLEQIIYEHAALLCRCSALLRELRGGEAPCPSP